VPTRLSSIEARLLVDENYKLEGINNRNTELIRTLTIRLAKMKKANKVLTDKNKYVTQQLYGKTADRVAELEKQLDDLYHTPCEKCTELENDKDVQMEFIKETAEYCGIMILEAPNLNAQMEVEEFREKFYEKHGIKNY